MEYRNINLTDEEIDLAVDALNMIYIRKLRKAQLSNQARSEKLIAELRLCQTLMQRLSATKNYEQIISTIGLSESDRTSDKDSSNA